MFAQKPFPMFFHKTAFNMADGIFLIYECRTRKFTFIYLLFCWYTYLSDNLLCLCFRWPWDDRPSSILGWRGGSRTQWWAPVTTVWFSWYRWSALYKALSYGCVYAMRTLLRLAQFELAGIDEVPWAKRYHTGGFIMMPSSYRRYANTYLFTSQRITCEYIGVCSLYDNLAPRFTFYCNWFCLVSIIAIS